MPADPEVTRLGWHKVATDYERKEAARVGIDLLKRYESEGRLALITRMADEGLVPLDTVVVERRELNTTYEPVTGEEAVWVTDVYVWTDAIRRKP